MIETDLEQRRLTPALPRNKIEAKLSGRPRSLPRLLARPALFLLGLAAAGFAFERAPQDFGAGAVDRFVVGQGLTGELIFLVAGAAFCAVGLPRQVVAFAGGYAFGLWGALLALPAQLLGCSATFFWARLVGRDWAMRRARGRLQTANRFLATNPFTATLTLRLLPIGSNVVLNILAAVSTIPAAPFLLASLVGYVPQTAVFVLLGSGVRVEKGTQLIFSAVLFAASAVLGIVLLRRRRAAAEIAEETDESVPN